VRVSEGERIGINQRISGMTTIVNGHSRPLMERLRVMMRIVVVLTFVIVFSWRRKGKVDQQAILE
jgi:hypothetical protein